MTARSIHTKRSLPATRGADTTATGSNEPPLPPDDARTSAARRGAATLLRRRNERRADTLDQMRAQIADGTLVVRQMTPAQQKAASRAARGALARNAARLEHTKALYNRNP
jgi:hypothetical protein